MVLLHIVGVPLLFNLFVVHGGEGVATLATYLAGLVRTLLDEIHLFGAFFMGSDEGFSYEYISGLELPDLGPFVVARDELLLVGCDADDDLLSFLLFQIYKFVAIFFLFCLMLGSKVLILGTMTLGGMIASKPNAKEK